MAQLDVVEARRLIAHRGTDALPITDVSRADLEQLTWSGSASHLRDMASQFDRVKLGEVAYLAVRLPTQEPVAKGGVDFAAHAGAGTICQMATRGGLEGLGLASRLIGALEDRIRQRGLPTARLSVETDNHRARRLYVHLGYNERGDRRASWEAERDDGSGFTYRATLVDMRRDLD